MTAPMTTHQKALKINLDAQIYGTIAEIGAGQDVAQNFFKAGGASGTIAKTISAYDMVFSDAIYGKEESGRYVCMPRLKKMLSYEYDLLQERLSKHRENTHFFAFANTVSARNFHGTNFAHGWLGVKFNADSSNEANEFILHVKMHDNSNLLQQEAIGILGVNILYAAFYKTDTIEGFVGTLMEDLSRHRVEIDMLEVSGPYFKHLDNRLLNLQLVDKGITDAVLFDKDGQVMLASDGLYKKNLMVVRGSYRPPTFVNQDMLERGADCFSKAHNIEKKEIVGMAEITLASLKEGGSLTHEDFLARVDLLNCLGQRVLITNFVQYYKLTTFLASFKSPHIGIVLGAYNFMQLFNEDYAQDLKGGLMEALGLLFRENSTLFIYPYKESDENDDLIQLDNLPITGEQRPLLDYIKSLGRIRDIQNFDSKNLHIYSRKVLNMIMSETKGWEQYVPKKIADVINEKCLFGNPCNVSADKTFKDN